MSYKRTAFITGGATRLGRETALHLAAKGWNIALHCRKSHAAAQDCADAIKALGSHAVIVQGDLQDSENLENLFFKVAETLGPVTALVNNAALFEKDCLQNLEPESFYEHMNINVLAPLMLAKAFAKQLGAREGSIINLLDGCTGLSLSANFLSYSLSKYALREATLLLAKDLAPYIRVNAVAPGLTLPKPGEEEMFERLVKQVPLQKATEPGEIASAIAFLLETPSLTGQILSLNGGLGVTT